MPWLPDKSYDEIEVELHPQQRRAYEEMKKEMIAWVGQHEDAPVVAPVVIAQLIRLQQFACGYATMGADGKLQLTDPSSKVDAVMQIVEDNPDQQIVIFSQFNQMLHLLDERLKCAKVPTAYYTGENRDRGYHDHGQREVEKDRFVGGSCRVLLAQIAAGGVGVDDLQLASHTMVFTDRLWSPALNNQAEDRLWRDGQMHGVTIIDIMARNTVDRGRKQHIAQSWEWIKSLLGDK